MDKQSSPLKNWMQKAFNATGHILVGFAIGSILMLAVLFGVLDRTLQNARDTSYAEGYGAGLLNQDWKELAIRDRAFTSKLCDAWWFGITPSERVGREKLRKVK